MSLGGSAQLAAVGDVDIDNSGRFKYILIKVYNKENTTEDEFKYIVRGYGRCGFHADIYDEVEPGITQNGRGPLECQCVGGGRILHKPEDKTMEVYGYSQGYGRPDHSISTKILQKHYLQYKITWSDEGY